MSNYINKSAEWWLANYGKIGTHCVCFGEFAGFRYYRDAYNGNLYRVDVSPDEIKL